MAKRSVNRKFKRRIDRKVGLSDWFLSSLYDPIWTPFPVNPVMLKENLKK